MIRRPLFLAAVLLVTAAALRLGTGGAAEPEPGCVSIKECETYARLLVTGQVYGKDESCIYLKSVLLSEANASGQFAADLQHALPCQENIICDTEFAGEIPLGSTVAVSGVFYPCSVATNPGEFDSAVYYSTLGVGGRLRKTEILYRDEEYWPLREGLFRLKSYFKERLYRIFPEKEAAVMSALLLGDKKELDGELKDLYKRNGILHILSISSLHITIIGMSLYRLLRKAGIPIGPAAAAGSILLMLYGCMTGFGVSACRAIGMYIIRMLGEMAGRTYDMLTALGVMAAVMVIGNPYYLLNSGFLLSFASVLGIAVLSPALMPASAPAKRGESSPGKSPGIYKALGRKIRSIGSSVYRSALVSLSITLATLPIQLTFYYEVPVYSVFLNLFVIPLMKPMMITGLLALLVPGLEILGMIDRLILGVYEFLCGRFDTLPFHTWNPGCPGTWQVIVYYFLLAGVIVLRRGMERRQEREQEAAGCGMEKQDAMKCEVGNSRNGTKKQDAAIQGDSGKGSVRSKKLTGGWGNGAKEILRIFSGKRGMLLSGLCVICLAVLVLGFQAPAGDSVTFLDVGQGDCIIVRTSEGHTYLFDCGSSSRSGVGKYVLIPYLKYSGIRRIEGIFLSHPDADHVNGAVELLEMSGENHISVGQLLLPAIEERAREEQLGELLAAAAAAKVPVGYLAAGDSFRSGDTLFTCLHPVSGFEAGDVNAYSECFYVEFNRDSVPSAGGGRQCWTLLLTGDVQGKGESAFLEEILKRNISGVTVLKAAHHGSRNSTPEKLLEQLAPALTVISSGRNNRYGHPHEELLERLEDCGSYILQTARSGAVTISFRNGEIRASAMLEGR